MRGVKSDQTENPNPPRDNLMNLNQDQMLMIMSLNTKSVLLLMQNINNGLNIIKTRNEKITNASGSIKTFRGLLNIDEKPIVTPPKNNVITKE